MLKNLIEKSVHIADIHVHQCIEPEQIPIKNIHQKSAEKSHQHAFLLAPHQAHAGRENDQQVRTDGSQSQRLEHRVLQNKTYDDHQKIS